MNENTNGKFIQRNYTELFNCDNLSVTKLPEAQYFPLATHLP